MNELSSEQARLVRSHLEEVISSSAFAGSKRSQDFLVLIVEHAMAGRFDSLRERMIGAEMFGRPVDYDTANDAVVRVKATEVRKKLSQFYREAAVPPPVRIELPSGSYVPKFHWEPVVDAHVESSPPASGHLLSPDTAEQVRPEPPSATLRPITRRSPYLLPSVLVGLCLLAAIGYWGFKSRGSRFGTADGIRSIAILPLQNLSGDPKQDYFADGVTEELTADLGQIDALRVISRTSTMTYKNTTKKLPQIARELGVDAIVEGSVWREDNRVRITAQLIDAKTDRHLWAENYDRDLTSVLAIEAEVAHSIAEAIAVELTPNTEARLSRERPKYAEGQEVYLQGLELLNHGSPREALGYLQDAVERDPSYAPAHVALADDYGWLGEAGLLPYTEAFPKQKSEALKAIELDDALPGGHAELAAALMDLNWDFTTPDKEYKRALALNPSAADIHAQYAGYLYRIGRVDDAIAQAKLNLQLDPVSSGSYRVLGFTDYYARHYDEALVNIQKANGIDKGSWEFKFPLGIIYVEKGMYDQAIAEFKGLGDQPHALGHLGNLYARMGRAAEAHDLIAQIQQHVQADGIGRYEIAIVYAGLGEKDQAFSWLEKAFSVRDKGLTYLKIDPCVDSLRSDPRFNELLRRVGLPT